MKLALNDGKTATRQTGLERVMPAYTKNGARPPHPLRSILLDVKSMLDGGWGRCEFCINNACNARCDFCNFSIDKLPKKNWVFVPLKGAIDAIDILWRQNIRVLTISGGEPMLHPNLFEILSYASQKGMFTGLVTNGSMLNHQSIKNLYESGLRSIIMSVDAPNAEVHENNRKLSKVCQKIKEANALFRKLGIQTVASVAMTKLITDYEEMAEFLKSLGFERVTFSYPLTTMGSSYLAYSSESSLVNYTPSELVEAFEKVKSLKRKKTITIMNPTASLEDMQRLVKGEPQLFPCLAGYKYFYLDWNLTLWRCHYWKTPIGSIYEFDDSKRIRDGCTLCMMDCHRDASVYQHIGVSISDSIKKARRGKFLSALRTLFTRRNFISLKAVLFELRWIIRN